MQMTSMIPISMTTPQKMKPNVGTMRANAISLVIVSSSKTTCSNHMTGIKIVGTSSNDLYKCEEMDVIINAIGF
jgi:hypothetical protein